jgi:ankyrin repeat protein
MKDDKHYMPQLIYVVARILSLIIGWIDVYILAWKQGISKKNLELLFFAAESGDAVAIHWQLLNGINPDIINKEGRTLLLQASQRGHISVVRELLESGARVNKTDNDHITPLMSACRSGHLGVAMLLREKLADINAVNKYKCDAFVWSAKYGNVEILKWLLSENVCTGQHDRGNRSAMDLALLFNHHAIIDILSEKLNYLLRGHTLQEFYFYAIIHDDIELLKRGLARYPNQPTVVAYKIPLLSIAIAYEAHECIRFLLSIGASMDAADEFGVTPNDLTEMKILL